MKKKIYRKPVISKREQNRVHSGACGQCYAVGCGSLVLNY